jgi:hypothetical protein
MLLIHIQQRHCNISDDNTDYALLNRIIFMRFLGLGINNNNK